MFFSTKAGTRTVNPKPQPKESNPPKSPQITEDAVMQGKFQRPNSKPSKFTAFTQIFRIGNTKRHKTARPQRSTDQTALPQERRPQGGPTREMLAPTTPHGEPRASPPYIDTSNPKSRFHQSTRRPPIRITEHDWLRLPVLSEGS